MKKQINNCKKCYFSSNNVLCDEFEPSDVITYELRYSFTNEPDDMGRWARKAIYRGLHIAWISRIESNGVVKFHVNTHFPSTGNDCPNKSEICNTYEDAKITVETLWNQFLTVCI